MNSSRTRMCVFSYFSWLAIAASPALALDPRLTLAQYQHTAWTQDGGQALPQIHLMTQSPDGYIWLGTSVGHLRFDGVRFSQWSAPLPPGMPVRIASSRDGAMWTVTRDGFTRTKGRDLRSFPRPSGLAMFAGPLEDRAGRIWLATDRGQDSDVLALNPRDGSVQRYGPADGLPDGPVRSMMIDGDAFWVGAHNAACRWVPGARAECHKIDGWGVAFTGGSGRDVYAATVSTVYRIRPGQPPAVVATMPDVAIQTHGLLLDRRGNLWLATSGGLFVLRGGRSERFMRKDGLSGDHVHTLLEDTEGDIWVSTNTGLDRFRDPRLFHLTSLDGLSSDSITAVHAARNGAVWVGTSGSGLNRIQGKEIDVFSPGHGLPAKSVYAIEEDVAGRIWLSDGAKLFVQEQGSFLEVPLGPQINALVDISADPAGGVWVMGGKLWRVVDRTAALVNAGQPGDTSRVLATRDGSVWLGSYNTGLLRLNPAGPSFSPPPPGVGGLPLRGLIEDDTGSLWVTIGPKLNRLRRGKVTTWGPEQGLSAGELSGAAIDRTGTLWLSTSVAVVRVALADLARSADGQPLPAHFQRYDHKDGLLLSARPGMTTPRIAAAPDGRIWVCERDGVAILDPELLHGNPVPPPVVIEEFTVDRRSLPLPVPPFRGNQVRIVYTANSLMAPERVRFRYRLEPVDTDWVDMENRRDVNFVGLQPGGYRFRVMACNLDDVCNEAGAAADFRIVPYFYQTIWAKLLALAGTGLSIWGFFRLRMRRVVARFHLVAQERARVTREIHDSLLQGFAGVVLQLGAASKLFETNPKLSKERLDRALDQADASLLEARQMLLDMRLPVLEDRTLAEALAEVGENATRNTAIGFNLKAKGEDRHLPYAAQAALFLIGREAINNAVNHANASRVSVTLNSSEKEVRLQVVDDGSGFDLDAGMRKAGHMGLESMRERAKQAGALFHIDAAPGRGVKVEVIVPRRRG